MAGETNGLYGNQYSQPVELAASTPSVPAHTSSASVTSSTSPQSGAPKADPQEIGWYFVEQFYSTLSKSPEKIHLFYSKKSQLVNGVEAEKVVPAVGAKAISEKIKAMDIQDCKVRVLNVDSQESQKNIVIQVIGEMSTRSEPHHKFVQTFVLAEQPNGYFVLNDIFRYLNDDETEIIEDEPTIAEIAQEEETIPVEPVEAPVEEKEKVQVTTEAAAELVDAQLEDIQSPEKEDDVPAVDETSTQAEEEEEEEEEDEEGVPVSEAETKDLDDETPAPVLAQEQPAEPEPTPAQSPPKATTPAPVVEAPPAKKTWASMVGTKAPAVPALPATNTPAPSQSKAQRPVQTPAAQKPSPAEPATTTEDSTSTQTNGWQAVDSGKKQNRPGSKSVAEQTTLAYIKNVNDKVDARILREVLEKFGELKYFDVSRPRNCAFVEFADPAGYAAAVVANPHDVGGEPINVEERRPRPGAFGGGNAGFSRGGTNNTGRGRGSPGLGPRSDSRGGTGGSGFPKDASRGTFTGRGAKTGGSVTPRGRGQAQAT